MDSPSKAAFRVGYADPLIESAQGAAWGVNKARPLINDATRVEFPAFTQGARGTKLQRQIGRENTMFETRARALGGSKTADNLANETALSENMGLLSSLARGNVLGAAGNLISRGVNVLKGTPESVRTVIADALLTSSPQQAFKIIDNAKISAAKRAVAREWLTKTLSGTVTGAARSQSQGLLGN